MKDWIMNNQPKVSVIIPIYNVEKYLRECLDSVVNQTLKDIEIICVNDGSTDSSAAICDEYAAKDPRVKVIHKPNAGYGHSMNRGLENATGEYIGIVESDDFAELNMFESLYNHAKLHEADVVKSKFWLYWSTPEVKNEKFENVGKYPINKITNAKSNPDIILSVSSIWSAIYRKDFLDRRNIKFLESPGASYQDTSFCFITAAAADRVFFTDEAFLHYRQDNENSSVKSKNKLFCICDEMQHIDQFLDNNPDVKQHVEQIRWVFAYGRYFWNYKRVSHELKTEFIERFAAEFRDAYSKNILSDEFYKHVDKKDLLVLINKKEIREHFKFLEYLFSIKNSRTKEYKIITILGLQIRIPRKNNGC